MSSSTSSTRPTARPQARPGQKPASPVSSTTIDPIKIVRQHMVLLLSTGVIGVVVGTVVFMAWFRYFPSYAGVVTFELVGTLEDAADPIASEERNEDTVQRIAATEALKVIDERALTTILKDPDVQRMKWMEQFVDPDTGRPNNDEALVELMDEISAGYRRRTQYFDVRWAARSKTDVPVMLNAVATHYIDGRDRERRRDKTEARQPFVENLTKVETEIASLENEIEDFISRTGMLSLTLNTTAVQSDLEDRELERNEVLSEIQRTIGLVSQLDAKLTGMVEWSQDDVREAENDQVVMRALSEVQTLRGLLGEHRQKFGPDHNQVRQTQKALDARIREKDRKVEEVILRNVQGQRKLAGDALERLRSVETALDDEIAKKTAEMNDFVAAQATLEKMRADLTRKEERRTRILDHIDQIEAMFSREDATEIQLVGSALTPREPASPKWFVVIPGTAILLLGFVTGLVFLREILDKRVRTTADLTGLPGARLLGVLPDIKDDPTDADRAETVVRDFPASVLAESHRQFAAAFRRAREDASAKSILFVGGMPGAGSTSVVANLASIAAAAGRRVLVVDGNLRRPRIAEIFGIDADEPGLGDVIVGESSAEGALHTTQEGIKVLTAGSPANRYFERLDSANLRKVIDEVSGSVDVIFVDGPPLVVASEAMGMTDQVDATVLVVRAYSEQRGLVARLMRQLGEQPSSFLGVVLNRPRNTAGGYFKRNYEAIAEYSVDRSES
ncbi:MAG: hypothetical protein VX726_05930 [Planctomycetota bacterium]|nr:hypothetical protein [Planctomycetota bacterium]